jgi:hypothetical protein
MKNVSKLFSVSLVTLYLLGCATIVHLTPENDAKIRNVAVITLIPEEIIVYRRQHSEHKISLEGRITATIEIVVNQTLTSLKPKWYVKQIQYDRDALTKNFNQPKLGGRWRDEIKKELAQIATQNGLDALLVIYDEYKYYNLSYSHSKDDSLIGLDIAPKILTFNFDDPRFIYAHALLHAVVIGRDGKIIADDGIGHQRKSLDLGKLSEEMKKRSKSRDDERSKSSEIVKLYLRDVLEVVSEAARDSIQNLAKREP